MKKFLYSKKAAPYVFILPFVLTFAIFWIVPCKVSDHEHGENPAWTGAVSGSR